MDYGAGIRFLLGTEIFLFSVRSLLYNDLFGSFSRCKAAGV
jgi:hypothetical protein